MTTENTDAATRILTKTIRKLAEQLAEADESIHHQEGKRKGAEDELTAVRAKLAGTSKPNKWEVRRGAHFSEWSADATKTVGQLADERMAELAELQQKLDELESLIRQPMSDYAARINKALDVLPRLPFDPNIAEAVRILRGEA